MIRTTNSNHALKIVIFTVLLDRPVDPETLKAIDALYPTLREMLPRRLATQGVMFQFGGPSLGGMPPSPMTGLTFDRLLANGDVARGLRIEGQTIQVLISDYQRWSVTWPEVKSLLAPVLSICLNTHMASGIGAQYVDQFFGPPGEAFPSGEALDPNSDLISPSIFKRGLPWHQHLGWFDDLSEPFPHRLLTQVNIDVTQPVVEAEETMMQVSLLHQANLEAPMSSELLAGAVSPLEMFFRAIHHLSKATFASMLASEMRSRIGLD